MTTNRKTSPEATKKTAKSAAGKTKAAATPENATSATQKATTQPPAAKKPAKRSAKPKTAASQAPPLPQLTPEQRRMYVEVAAYYIAERRGFQGGSELEDWVQAEAEIDRLLREGILKP